MLNETTVTAQLQKKFGKAAHYHINFKNTSIILGKDLCDFACERRACRLKLPTLCHLTSHMMTNILVLKHSIYILQPALCSQTNFYALLT